MTLPRSSSVKTYDQLDGLVLIYFGQPISNPNRLLPSPAAPFCGQEPFIKVRLRTLVAVELHSRSYSWLQFILVDARGNAAQCLAQADVVVDLSLRRARRPAAGLCVFSVAQQPYWRRRLSLRITWPVCRVLQEEAIARRSGCCGWSQKRVFLCTCFDMGLLYPISRSGIRGLQGWQGIPKACKIIRGEMYSALKGNKRTKAESPGCKGLVQYIVFGVVKVKCWDSIFVRCLNELIDR